MKIIDSFLFFQELELLEIRLKYLYPLIDKFIIVESNQSFTGKTKNYNFELNLKRFSKYLDKIHYHKIKDIHYDYYSLKKYLKISGNRNTVLLMIEKFLNGHNYYDKNNLSHILDSYHRECIHIPLLDYCEDDDLVITSDLDEIPNYGLIKNIKRYGTLDRPKRLIQHEFQFFLNNYSNSNWKGSIVSTYKNIKKESLNNIRRSSKNLESVSNGGYHFTSIGNLATIKNKIESWAHQEYNHPLIKKNIESNINHGKDIFYRFNKNRTKVINVDNKNIFDNRISKIINKYDELIVFKIKENFYFDIKYKSLQFLFLTIRILSNPIKAFKKLSNKFLV